MIPLISIIVTCWNGEKYLEECLESLFNQKYPNFEIILSIMHQQMDQLNLLRKISIGKNYM